jgi:uncharacterized protein (TIGR02117 family)
MLLGVFAFACTGLAPMLLPSPNEPAPVIYLVSHGWHTGLVLKRVDIPAALWPESRDFPEADYLEVGWGDWDYYQTPEPGLGLTLKAAFWPTASVLHVVGFHESVTEYFPTSEIIALKLSLSGLECLVAYIHDSYARDDAAKTAPLGKGLYGDSRFYPARGKFHLFNTCNVWTARALRAAGYPIGPFTAITANDLMSQARAFGKVVQAPEESQLILRLDTEPVDQPAEQIESGLDAFQC